MFKEEDDPSFRQNQKASSGGLSVSQSARAQKWLDQLVQVESRMLSNWEEFSAHRNDVQHRFAELAETLRRKQEPHLESELEKCSRRLQQLSQSNEETLCRMGDLKTAVENGQQSLEGLRARVSTKLQEMGTSFEEHKKDLLSRVSEELQAEASSSKRQSKALGEELLRKMAELNQKLGENMSSVEEESISRFEGLRGDVQALTKRLDAAPRPEVELRKTEAYFESQLRSLRAEMHSQLEELAASANRSENARVKGLQENAQELTQRLERVASEATSGKACAERTEQQLQDLRQQQRAEMEEQLERLRDEIAVKAGKEAKAQSEALAQLSRKLQSSEELLERCCETSSEVEVLKIADGERAMLLEQLSRSCNDLAEGRQGFLAEVDSCRSANRQLEDSLRRMDARVESLSSTASHCSEGVADVKAAAREAEKSQLQFREMLEQRTSELQELLERRAYESSAKMEALRLADAERQRQLEQLSMACENLAEARQGIVAEVESCRSIDRQLEEALRRLDARVERAAGTALQCSEGVADVKVFARELSEKALSQSRDLMDKRNAEMKELIEQQAAEHVSKLEALKLSDSECHQQLDFLSRAFADLSEARRGIFAEVESCQSSDRKLEEHVRRMENKLERLSSATSQCSEGLAEAKALAQQSAEKVQQHSSEQLELRSRELKDHLKHLREELSSNFAKEAKAQSDAIALLARKQELSTDSLQAGTSELRRTVEAQFRRQELIEHQAAENAPKLEALRNASAEQGKQLQSLGKSSAELSEARRGISADVEKCQSASRRLEEELQHALAKIEKVSSAANQSFEGVAEVKGFARQLVESSVMELKEQLERRIEALKTSEVDHQQQLERLWRSHMDLTETKKGLTGELEKCQSVERQFEEALRRVDGKVDRAAAVASQCSEGVSEAKAFARQAVENVVVQSRALLEQRTGETKEQLERLRDEMAVKAAKETKAQNEALAQLSRKLQSTEELLERCRETSSEVEVLKIADSERATLLEQLSRSCNELAEGRQGFLAEVDSCRSANRQLEDSLRRMDDRVESLSSTASHCSEGVAEVKAVAREAEKSQLQFREMSEQRTNELQELLERRAYESSAKMEALRSADAERQRQLEQLSMACENLAEARQGIVAEVESCRSIDRQLEEALRRLDARVERAAGTALQCSEGVADVKVFARELSEKAVSQSRDLMEKRHAEMKELIEQQGAEHGSKLEALKVSDSECHQQLDSLSRGVAELSEARRGISAEVESCQSSDRKLEEHLRRMENKLERLSSTTSQCSEGLAEAKALAQQSAEKAQQHSSEQLELRSRELKDHLKHLREELSSSFAKEAKGQSDAITQLARKQELSTDSLQAGTSELRRAIQEQCRRQELIEHQAAENAPLLEALRSASAEQSQQLQSLGKSSAELSEARRGISADVEKCQSANRRLEEELQHALAKIEKVSSAANQSFEGVAEVKVFARQLVESSVMELKEQLERRSVDASSRIEALKTSEVDHQQQLERLWRSHTELTETKKGLAGELEKCQSVERQFEEALRRVDGKVDRVAEVASQCSEGVSEVKAFARQAVENVVVQSRDLLEQRTGEMKARSEAANEELRALRLFVQEETQRQVQAGRAEATEREHRLSSKLLTQAQEAQELRTVLDEQLKRQESLSAELREAQEVFHSKVSKVSTEFAEQKDGLKKYITDALRKSEQKLQALTAQPRVLALVMDELEGVVRGVTQRELQIFQREALDSMEWKLERCVQWLHGANVKLGLNPQGTLFSTDRFREMLFEEAEPTTPGSHPQSARTARVRSGSRGRS